MVSLPLELLVSLLLLLAMCSARANALDSASFLAYSVGELGVLTSSICSASSSREDNVTVYRLARPITSRISRRLGDYDARMSRCGPSLNRLIG